MLAYQNDSFSSIIQRGDHHALQERLQSGAQPSIKPFQLCPCCFTLQWDPPAWYALRHHAIDASDPRSHCIMLLLKAAGKLRRLCLFDAVTRDDATWLGFILRCGNEQLMQDFLGNSALHIAAYLGHQNSLKILLQHGGKPRGKNTKGQTALDLAYARQHLACVALLREAWHTNEFALVSEHPR